MYDRLGVQKSDNGSTWTNVSETWMLKSASTTAPWSKSFGSSGPGWIFPETEVLARAAGSGDLPIEMNLNTRYLRFWFWSDVSTREDGWNITLKAKGPVGKIIKTRLKLKNDQSLYIHNDRRHRALDPDHDIPRAGLSGSSGPTFNPGNERVGLPGDQQSEKDIGQGFQDYEVKIQCSYKGGISQEKKVKVTANERYIELVIRSWRDLTDRGWRIHPCWYYYLNTHFGTRVRFDNFGAWIQRNTKAKNVPNPEINYVYIHLHPDIIRNWLWISDRDHIDSRREEFSTFVYGLWGYSSGLESDEQGSVDRTSGTSSSGYAGANDPDPRHGLNAKTDSTANDIAWDGRNYAHCTFGDEPYGNGNPIKIDGKYHLVPGSNGFQDHEDWHEIINYDPQYATNTDSTENADDDERGIKSYGNHKDDHYGDRFGGNRWQGRFRWAPGRRSENAAYLARYGSPDRVSIGWHNYYNIQDLQYIFYFKDEDENGNGKVYEDKNAYVFIDENDHSKGTKLYDGDWSVSRNDLFALLGQLKQKFGHPEKLGDDADQSTEGTKKFKRGDVWRIYPNMNFLSIQNDAPEAAGRTAPRTAKKVNVIRSAVDTDAEWELTSLKQNYDLLEFGKDGVGDYFFDVELILKEFDSNKYNDGNEGSLNAHDNGPTINFGQLWKFPVGLDDGVMNTYNYDWKIESTDTRPEVVVYEYDTDEDLGPDRKTATKGSSISGDEHYNGNSNMEMNMYIGNPRIIKTAHGFAEPGWLPGGEGALKKPEGGGEPDKGLDPGEDPGEGPAPGKGPDPGEPIMDGY